VTDRTAPGRSPIAFTVATPGQGMATCGTRYFRRWVDEQGSEHLEALAAPGVRTGRQMGVFPPAVPQGAFFGSIRPRFEELRPEFCKVRIRKRRSVIATPESTPDWSVPGEYKVQVVVKDRQAEPVFSHAGCIATPPRRRHSARERHRDDSIRHARRAATRDPGDRAASCAH